ncbi:MAG: transaldolase [Deltaproteobacteria bacterium]|nr:transaldolase [Deltaproteobacteria bacterium]
MNPLKDLNEHGQSVWLDFIQRKLLTGGELRRLVDEDGLKGVTSNPAIFEKAIADSDDYDDLIARLGADGAAESKAVYEAIATRDIQEAADVLRTVYDETDGRDGYVSLEVSPYLAHDTEGTVAEARRLWSTVARDNLMIKVPGTAAGVPAIERLIGEGISVNVTLLFAREAYEQVAQAYIRGLAKAAADGRDVARIASVASFFISRIDSLVDDTLTKRIEAAADDQEKERLRVLMGKVAIANAKVTYKRYKEILQGEGWQALSGKGARPQRLLWASTSTKNPDYPDVLYVDELIGKDTVNTIPPATLDAFRDHGKARTSLEEDVEGAAETMAALEAAGVSMKEVTDKLLEDGVRLFSEAFDKLLAAVEAECRKAADRGGASS